MQLPESTYEILKENTRFIVEGNSIYIEGGVELMGPVQKALESLIEGYFIKNARSGMNTYREWSKEYYVNVKYTSYYPGHLLVRTVRCKTSGYIVERLREVFALNPSSDDILKAIGNSNPHWMQELVEMRYHAGFQDGCVFQKQKGDL